MRVRELRFDDYEASAAVLERNGLRRPSPDQWQFLWDGAPYRAQLADIPFGWVLEHPSDGIVGTFRNAAFLYEWNRRPVRVAVASAWAVDERHRRHSLMLASEYFKQTHADVLLNTTAVEETSGRAFLAFRAERVPQAGYMTRMLWITGYRGFAGNLLRERRVPAAAVAQYPAAVAAWTADLGARRRRAARASSSIRVVETFDERFDRFWAAQRERIDRLQQVRDRAALAWRYALEREAPIVVVLARGTDLDGFIVCVLRNRGSARRAEVADLQVRDDEPALAGELMAGALGIARRRGLDLVALSGHNETKRRGLAELKPHVKTAAGWPLYYKAIDETLTAPLRSSSAWDLSLADGDALWSGAFSASGAGAANSRPSAVNYA